MPDTDINGRAYARAGTVKENDWLECDGGFDCLRAGDIKQVKRFAGDSPNRDPKDPLARLYIECQHEGHRHFINGQCDDNDGALVGLYPVSTLMEK